MFDYLRMGYYGTLEEYLQADLDWPQWKINVFSWMGVYSMDKTATATAYLSSASAVVFGLSASDVAALVGAGIAILSFAVNFWFRWQQLQLSRAKMNVLVEDHQQHMKHQEFVERRRHDREANTLDDSAPARDHSRTFLKTNAAEEDDSNGI